MEPISVNDSKYKKDDRVIVSRPNIGDITGTITSVQVVKDLTRSDQWTYRYVIRADDGGVLAAPERIVKKIETANGGKRKTRRRRRGKTLRRRRRV